MGVLHTYACCFSYSSHLREPICGRTCCVSPLGAAASAQAPLRLLLLHVSDTSYALLGAVRLSAAHPARRAKQRRAALGLPVTPQPPGSGRNRRLWPQPRLHPPHATGRATGTGNRSGLGPEARTIIACTHLKSGAQGKMQLQITAKRRSERMLEHPWTRTLYWERVVKGA